MSKAGLAGVGSQAAFDAADSQVAELKRAPALSNGMSYVNGDIPSAAPQVLVAECIRIAENMMSGSAVPGPCAAYQAEIALYVATQVLKAGELKGGISTDVGEQLRAQIGAQRDSVLSLKESPLATHRTSRPALDVPEHNGNM